jgi:hypothetical protein
LTDKERRKASGIQFTLQHRPTKRSKVACGKLRRLDQVSNYIQTRLLGGPNLTSSRRLRSSLLGRNPAADAFPFVHFASEETPCAYFFRDLHTKRYRNLPWGLPT